MDEDGKEVKLFISSTQIVDMFVKNLKKFFKRQYISESQYNTFSKSQHVISQFLIIGFGLNQVQPCYFATKMKYNGKF
ncbi:unnamed protein product [Paramecium primaurelia]|uniref:Uncharacterized protein n=1 Tax=Paramecium primaurelia TaxID=5886 RepID=A0A8S1PWX4_PARPR|nr:unnamed protein product [Paramecium primaurelia]